MPPTNQRRRAELADAAIALLAESGVHGVTHRAVERRAGLPAGTASNYFRSREALLTATADRVGELHASDMEAVAERQPPAGRGGTRERATELIAASLLLAATTHRDRYLAIFELHLESLRRPALAGAMDRLRRTSLAATIDHHAKRGLDIPAAAVPALMTLYGGALYTLVTGPAGGATPAVTRDLARAIVLGALA